MSFVNIKRFPLLMIFVLCTSLFGAEKTVSSTNEKQCWPGFLGTGATPIASETIPLRWSPTKNIAWQASLPGKGQSSPVIWSNQVYATSIDGKMKNRCFVTAIALSDGKELWSYQEGSSQPVRSNYFQSRSAPTPVVDANGVYAFFETGNLFALDHQGNKLWSRSLTEQYGEFEVRIGLASSLLQTKTNLVVLIDHEGPSYLLAVDKKTGKTKWKTERFSRQSYASPSLINIEGTDQIVCSSSGSIDGYDPEIGKQLWTFEEVGGNRACTPFAFGKNHFLIGASPGMHDAHLEKARQSNFAMKVRLIDGQYQPEIVWKARKAMPSFGSPIVYQGLAYWVSKVGVIYCFDATTGEQIYVKRSGQQCWATPLGLGDHVYLFGKEGLTTVIKSGKTYEVIAENELIAGAQEAGEKEIQRRIERHKKRREKSEASQENSSSEDAAPRQRDGLIFADPVQYGYGVVNGSLVIRTGSKLHCIRKMKNSTELNQKEKQQ